MPKLKINKKLNRPDGGVISAGSVAKSIAVFNEDTMEVNFPLYLYVSENALNNNKKPIPSCVEFSSRLTSGKSELVRMVKKCSEDEWLEVNTGGQAGQLTNEWFKNCIDEIIGAGYTEEL